MKKSARQIALKSLCDIDNGKLLNEVLDKNVYNNEVNKYNSNMVNLLVRGVLEYKLCIDKIINKYTDKNKKIEKFIKNIFRLALYEKYKVDKSTNYAIVNEYVNIVKTSKYNRYSGFTNAVLRKLVNDNSEFEQIYPEWICKMIKDDYDNEVLKKIIKAEGKSLSFRIINEKCIEGLVNKYSAKKSNIVDNVYEIKDISNIENIDEFISGDITIQDASSVKVGNIAKDLLKFKKNIKILDICAAPGGKATHVAETKDSFVYACDISEKKLLKIKENVSRLNINNIKFIKNDARLLNQSFIDKFDLVICDLPCSGLGLLHKKTDLRYRLKKEDIYTLSSIQKKILTNSIEYIKDNGYLIFSTCTISKIENILNFDYLSSKLKVIEIEGMQYKQYIQGIDECDGFFISVFQKKREDV